MCAEGLRYDGKECVLEEGKTWADLVDVCAKAEMTVSIDGSACGALCGENEKAVDGRCVCKSSSVYHPLSGKCILRDRCGVVQVVGGMQVCTDKCGENYELADGSCVTEE